ncbi:MAG: polymer-forming cytoskeletal protein [Clostridiales bacterium]|nr:polymer-forming cytoskeletal protein [Clostridiales bacterium]
MGFFKEFREDCSQAVNELLSDKPDSPDSDSLEPGSEEPEKEENVDDELEKQMREALDHIDTSALPDADEFEPFRRAPEAEQAADAEPELEEDQPSSVAETDQKHADEVTVIEKGTRIEGSICADGSVIVHGVVTGDVTCLGSLTITGQVCGDSTASDIYVNAACLEGKLESEGTVEVGVGTVVIGDIKASSGVFAGAVKGEIDINGPVIVDSTAVIKGNIKAKSVQINNGAVVDGYCSLSYATIDIEHFFESEEK